MTTFLLGLLHAALAAPRPGPRALDAGTTVRVDEVGKKDAFWRFRAEIEGLICVVEEPGLVRHRGRWYAGAVACSDGQEYYFYQVVVTAGDFAMPTHTPPPEPPALDLVAEPRPPPARPDPPSPWPVGALVRIRAVSPIDATSEGKVVGQRCEVVEAPLLETSAGWLSGSLRCEGAEPRFYYQVAVDALPAGTSLDGRLRGAEIPAGRAVRVVEVSALDLHWRDRARLVGTTCTVLAAPLAATGESWYAGRLLCGDQEWQLFQVAVAEPDPVTPSPRRR